MRFPALLALAASGAAARGGRGAAFVPTATSRRNEPKLVPDALRSIAGRSHAVPSNALKAALPVGATLAIGAKWAVAWAEAEGSIPARLLLAQVNSGLIQWVELAPNDLAGGRLPPHVQHRVAGTRGNSVLVCSGLAELPVSADAHRPPAPVPPMEIDARALRAVLVRAG